MRKFDFENTYFLTTVTGVEQLDDDRIQFYRRQDNAGFLEFAYEKVIIDRANRSITSELIDALKDRSVRLYERGTLSELPDDKVMHKHLVFDH